MKSIGIAVLSLGCVAFVLPSHAKDVYPPLDILLSSTKTIIGQPFTYPKGEAKMTSAIVTMMPGQSTGWHRHEVPLFAYVLAGEITVDYADDGVRLYKTGDSLIEAFQTSHNGTNTGDGPVRILAVFAGAQGAINTVSKDN